MNIPETFKFLTSRNRMGTRVAGVVAAALLASASIGPAVVSAPLPGNGSVAIHQQNVDWMSSETASYLGSIGMDVMVPSWIPSPFTGVAPDVYAGGGSYSLYWMAPGSPPTFLHITGVAGAGFPDGSKADLNVPLSVNADVQGWPAVRDIGIPAGGTTPIYDQVFWIVGGVRYSIESNNIGTDSLTMANSMLFLQAPVYEEPTWPPVTEEPYVPPTSEPAYEEPVSQEPTYQEPVVDTEPEPVFQAPTSTTAPPSSTGGTTNSTSSTSPSSEPGTTAGTGTTSGGSMTTEAPWSPGKMDGSFPSDGTAGPRPPVIGGDGTGGLYDTSLPRIIRP